jgi:serine/threonine-protein kinase
VQTTAADPLVGRTLEGRYRILDRIARGGMSTVYSAIDERLDRLVAVKVMSAALSADPAFSDRFTREARAAARLTHLNTVAVYDQGTDSGDAGQHVFLVMELVSGRTLRDLLRERGRLEPAEAVSIMEPVLSALSAAHRAGLVHRDVKPENILLSDDGIVKVADFGLARAVESDPTATRTGLMMGTIAYCAPEQLSKGRADQRSDVYSAGVVFFELLTGSPPYRGDTAMNIAYQHVHSRVPAPSSRVKGIPSEIDELVIDATDSDPEARPPDASAFLAALGDLRQELALPVVAVPQRPRGQNVAPPSWRRGSDSPSAVTDVLRGADDGRYGPHDTSVVGQEAYRPPPAANPPVVHPPGSGQAAARARRRRRALLTALIVILVGIAAGYTGWWFATGRYGKVPNVVGDSQSSAITALRQAGYQVSGTTASAFSETVATGSVVATSPSVGSRLPHGRTISLVLSKGKERFKLPSVVNTTVSAARHALSVIPVEVAAQTVSQPNDTVPKGMVSGTQPGAGTLVKRNQSITLVVSSGPPIVTIPSVSPNTSLGDETKVLQALGFKTATTDTYSTSVPAGDVVSVKPTGSAPKFSTITITVSKGPPTVVIPSDLNNLPTVDAARKELERLGLKVKVQTAFGGSHGVVVGLDPPAGTVVPVGSTVTITSI